jgi:hypothetical protein
VGIFTVNSFMAEARRRGYTRVISLTRNPRLQSLYRAMGFVGPCSLPEYAVRQALSPGTPMFIKENLGAHAMDGQAE